MAVDYGYVVRHFHQMSLPVYPPFISQHLLSITYTIPFNTTTTAFFSTSFLLFFTGMTLRTFHYLAPTIPESVYCTFQLTFAIITAALICGSFADRMKVCKPSQKHSQISYLNLPIMTLHLSFFRTSHNDRSLSP